MSSSAEPQPHPEAVYYNQRLAYSGRDLVLLAERAAAFPLFRKYLRYLIFYIWQLRSTLPKRGAAIGPRWWHRYARFYAMVEDLRHPEFDDDLDNLWDGLPQTP
ncbi:MAG: hypothetical protein AABO58_08345 [Acidobacteriota bacterium]